MLNLTTMTRLLSISFVCLMPAAHVHAADVGSLHKAGEPQVKVHGKIVDVGATLITVKTPIANYTLNKETAPLKVKIGDEVTLWVTSSHVVIDHHRQTTGQRHRVIMGALLNPESKNEIKLWTPEGNKIYSLAEHEAKTKHLPEGTMVAVEINEAGNVIDLHPVETEVEACDKRHHCTVMVHGRVRKIEESMIFIKTPVVEYEIPTNIAPPTTAPGDEMTLWVHENDVVLNYSRAGEMSHRRFVTGPLRYTDKTRAHIKLWTPEGEQTFPLSQLMMARDLRAGHPVTLEISEVGDVIDLWQSS